MSRVLSFFGKKNKKSFDLVGDSVEYRVQYLGNVITNTMRGEGCTNKPMVQIWAHYKSSMQNNKTGIEMKLLITPSGLRAQTKEQGETHYHANKITYAIAHPDYPKVFCWVYKHQRRIKVEFRCHAVLCRTDSISKAIAVLLHENLKAAFRDFLRYKKRQHETRQRQEKLKSVAKSVNLQAGALNLNHKSLVNAPPHNNNSSWSPVSKSKVIGNTKMAQMASNYRPTPSSNSFLNSIEEMEDEPEPEEDDKDNLSMTHSTSFDSFSEERMQIKGSDTESMDNSIFISSEVNGTLVSEDFPSSTDVDSTGSGSGVDTSSDIDLELGNPTFEIDKFKHDSSVMDALKEGVITIRL